MKKYIKALLIGLAAISVISCEDVVEIDVTPGETQLVVDAFINNRFREQEIKLTYSKPYFSTSQALPATGASVTVEDLLNEGKVITFTDTNENGVYTWMPTSADDTLQIRLREDINDETSGGFYQEQYKLSISMPNGEAYEAFTSIERVPTIDSIQVYKEEESLFYPVETIVAELWAYDLKGKNDYYWVKTWKNGKFLNKVSEMNLVHDIIPGTNNDENADGVAFIPPVRTGINPNLDADEIDELPLYEVGDSIYVEIHSLTDGAFGFMSMAKEQMQNGGLFATPVVNLPTNIIAINEQSEGKAIGYFSGSAIKSYGIKINEEPPYKDNN
ncbi:DUF4249 domain-containing protein [Limibacter armeniacum]|uniref:DUF4249 domain-containing protein n=1 Tax=Limibacter armeniacum TaxID=466084 RepID=UPI002FE56A33